MKEAILLMYYLCFSENNMFGDLLFSLPQFPAIVIGRVFCLYTTQIQILTTLFKNNLKNKLFIYLIYIYL